MGSDMGRGFPAETTVNPRPKSPNSRYETMMLSQWNVYAGRWTAYSLLFGV